MADSKKKYSVKRVISNGEHDIVMEEFHVVDEKDKIIHAYMDRDKAEVALLKLQKVIKASLTLNAYLNMGGTLDGIRSSQVCCVNPFNDSVIDMEILDLVAIDNDNEIPQWYVTFDDKTKSIFDAEHIIIETKLMLFKE